MSEKQKNRAKYPDIAQAVDELRKHFGDVRVTELKDKG